MVFRKMLWQVLKKSFYTGCSKTLGCKACVVSDTCLQAIMRNAAYFAVRRSDPAMAGMSTTQQLGVFQQPDRTVTDCAVDLSCGGICLMEK
ncbi:MAG: hypothetical protein FJ119_01460 [Deltaproteobacteria bacterium]|nr:hypothetical protein [Deltaproteobacteria bacterium]